MDSALESSSSRGLLIAFCALVTVGFSYEAVKLELAEHRIWSDNLTGMSSAAYLEPGYAEYWDRLGRFRQFGLDEQDLPGALEDYEKAVKISPVTARYWIDLAIVHENLGDAQKARTEFDIARQVYPSSAEVHWEFANFLLRQGQESQSLVEMRAAVKADPSLLSLAVDRAWRATNDADEVANAILPREAGAYIEAINSFGAEDNVNAGLKVWRHLADLHQPFQIEKLFPFFDVVIHDNRGADGKRMWIEALAACGRPHDLPTNGSVVWNGGFEFDMLNGGFDWRMPSSRGMTAEYDTTIFHGGKRSLRLDFGGGINLDLEQPLEFVAVEPNQRYHFAAFVRTEGITTESGLRFTAFDPSRRDAIHLNTQGITGTHDWTELSADILTGEETQILQVELRRQPSRMFENKLEGTAWIDDVSLVPLNASTRDAQQTRGSQ